MASVDFYFDFGSPNAYFSYRVLPQIAERTGANIIYKPVLLGGIFKATGNQSPFMAYGNVQAKIEYDMIEIERFIQRHKLNKFKFNSSFPVNTLLLMRGAIWAEREGRLADYIEAGMTAMWEADQNMGDGEVFAAWFSKHGFDGQAILAATQDPEIKQGLMDATNAGVERKLFGIPTFFVGDEIYFGKDRLWMVEEALAAS